MASSLGALRSRDLVRLLLLPALSGKLIEASFTPIRSNPLKPRATPQRTVWFTRYVFTKRRSVLSLLLIKRLVAVSTPFLTASLASPSESLVPLSLVRWSTTRLLLFSAKSLCLGVRSPKIAVVYTRVRFKNLANSSSLSRCFSAFSNSLCR